MVEKCLAQRKKDLRAAKNSFGTAECSAGLLDKEIKFIAPLVRDNIAPTKRLLELQRQLEQVLSERDLGSIRIE